MTPAIPDAALEADIAILGKKGRGKTYVAKGVVERLLAMGRRVVVLDPLSTWWGLKAGPNGFAIPVLGGPHGDLPLADRDGAALGRHLAASDGSAVLDLGHFRRAELVRFATAFLDELYTGNRRPLTLVLEEADVFAPQQPMADNARLLGEVDRIARRGRQFGFRLISLTQRPAKLHKDVLTQLSTLVALGITSPQDREAIKAWVEGNADRDQAKAVVDSLASLKVGEGWVWAPDLGLLDRVTFPKIRTPDTSATPHAGTAPVAPAVRTDVDLAGLRAALVPVEPESKATRKAVSNAVASSAIEAERRGYDQGYAEGVTNGRSQALMIIGAQAKALEETISRVRSGDMAAPLSQAEGMDATAKRRSPRSGAPPHPEVPAGAASARGVIPELSPTARRILDVLEAVHPVALTFRAAALRAGASPRSSQFRQYRRELLDSGAAIADGDRFRAARGDRAKGGRDVLAAYMAKLPPSQAAMLAVVAGTRRPLTRDDIADQAEVSRTSSGLGGGLRALVAMGLLVRTSDGSYRLSGALRDPPEEP